VRCIESNANSVNERGQVAGSSPSPFGFTHAVTWVNGEITDLQPFDFSDNYAHSINERGQVAGYANTSTGLHAMVWDEGNVTDLGTLPGEGFSSIAYNINDRGEVAGYSFPPNGGSPRAVVWDPEGRITDLGTLPGGSAQFSIASSINERGQIVGYSSSRGDTHAVLWEKTSR
jgi:probable HAF family extracellular repeat protein